MSRCFFEGMVVRKNGSTSTGLPVFKTHVGLAHRLAYILWCQSYFLGSKSVTKLLEELATMGPAFFASVFLGRVWGDSPD